MLGSLAIFIDNFLKPKYENKLINLSFFSNLESKNFFL